MFLFKKWIYCFLLASFLSIVKGVGAIDKTTKKYLTVDKVLITKLPSQDIIPFDRSLEKNLGEDQAFTQIDQLIAYGKEMWKLVEAGRPVYDQSMANTLSVVPKELGANGEFYQMTNWSRPQVTNYRLSYVNLYGMEVVRFDYSIYFQFGGQYLERGKYLTSVTIYPVNVMVAWGYQLNAISKVAAITNNGTSEAPIAGVTLQIESLVKTVIKTQQLSTAFHLTGEGELIKLN